MANRALTAAMITELEASVNRPVLFYEGVFVGFTLRLWTGSLDISWNGQTWAGNGWFRGFSGVEEDNDMGATGMELTLAGVPQDLISAMLGYAQHGASGKLWLGMLDADFQVIEDPYLVFDGKLDIPTIDDSPDGPIIQVSYESALSELDRTREYRYTTESQRVFNHTDMGFQYVEQLAEGWKGQWGATQKQVEKKKEREEPKKKKGGGQKGGRRRK